MHVVEEGVHRLKRRGVCVWVTDHDVCMGEEGIMVCAVSVGTFCNAGDWFHTALCRCSF